jgi:methylenetetrahydrofolate dehydrogenase (NADP+)/methenyltetrahydrofolate cyclohydrolase
LAQILDGKAVAVALKAEIKAEVADLRERGIQPHLAVILVGDDPASRHYAAAKEKVAAGLGISLALSKYEQDTPQVEVVKRIRELNAAEYVHGIMLELPLPAGFDIRLLTGAIDKDKDVDGVTPLNRGRLMAGEDGLFPATPQACLELLLRHRIPIAGQRAVIIGRGETVGKPLIFSLLQANATVTVCHSRTLNLAEITREADILLAACGKAGLITGDMIKPGAAVVDAGYNETASGVVGDVDFITAETVAGWISPVPGGVGSLTTTLLLKNVLQAVKLQGKGRRQ